VEDPWQERYNRAADVVEKWSARLREDVGQVDPGSPLAGDDASAPDHGVSGVAWWGILSAVDHLATATAALKGAEGSLRPYAPFTLTRSALVGAAHAVWVLSPPRRADRIHRSACLERHEYQAVLDYLDDYLNADDVVADMDQKFVEQARAARARHAGTAARLSQTIGGAAPNETRMLREAAALLSPDDMWVRQAIGHEWRFGSASAHGRQWPYRLRGAELTPLPGGSHSVVSVKRETSEFVQSFGVAVLMTNEAWRLYDQRRAAP
jgi:hypothetical protein